GDSRTSVPGWQSSRQRWRRTVRAWALLRRRVLLRVVGDALGFEHGRGEVVVVGHGGHEALVAHLTIQIAHRAEWRLNALDQTVIAEDLRFLVHHPIIGIAPAIG